MHTDSVLFTCNACFDAHNADALGSCTLCGASICGLNGCDGDCACGQGEAAN